MKYRKLKGYSVRSQYLYRLMKKRLKNDIKEGKIDLPLLDENTIKGLVEGFNKKMADQLKRESRIVLPYIGVIDIVERKRIVDLKNNRINLPVHHGLTEEYEKMMFITDLPRMIGVKFRSFKRQHPHLKLTSFRLNHELFKEIAKYAIDNNILLAKV